MNWKWSMARKIMAKEYGCESIIGMEVHHKDGKPWNNDISNLEILSVLEHRRKHTAPKPLFPCAIMIIRNIPKELHRALKMQAAREGRSMASIIIELVGAYVVAQREGKP